MRSRSTRLMGGALVALTCCLALAAGASAAPTNGRIFFDHLTIPRQLGSICADTSGFTTYGGGQQVDVSPDGTTIAYLQAATPFGVALQDFATGAVTQLSGVADTPLGIGGSEWPQFSPDGKFGGALETFPGWPVEDAPHRASAKAHPDLTPRGAFTVEMWIRPKPDMKGYPESFLLDNRYVDKTGMQLVLSAESGAMRNLRMELGFGADTEVFASDHAPVEVDVWTHVAFTYDGAGTGSLFINGSLAGTRTAPGRKDVAPGVKDLMIGDRVGSYYHGFPGFIDQGDDADVAGPATGSGRLDLFQHLSLIHISEPTRPY